MLHAVSLGVVLFALWWSLSGYWVALLLALGVASTVLVLFVAHRMDVIDREGHPIHLTWRAFIFYPWLLWEIAKSNYDIALVILQPRMPIRPRVITVHANQAEELGRVIYGNSITLTPGTVTIQLEDSTLQVHALTDGAAEALMTGEMDQRVCDLEGLVKKKKEGAA